MATSFAVSSRSGMKLPSDFHGTGISSSPSLCTDVRAFNAQSSYGSRRRGHRAVVLCKADSDVRPVISGLAADSVYSKSTLLRRLTSVFGGAASSGKGGNSDSNTLSSDTTTVICSDDYHSLDRYCRKEKKERNSIEKPICNHVMGLLDSPETNAAPNIFVTGGRHPMSGLDSSSFQRREVLGKAAAFMMSVVSLPALAAEDNFTLYQDEEDKFSLLVPQEWTKGEGNAGTRKVTAFFPESDNSANVNIIITGLGADYTALGSFGTVDIFAENLVNSLDRAWQRPKGQAAKLIDARSRNGMYYVEYTIQKPGEAKRHLLSVVGIASNGWINRLYTVTGQYWEDDSDKYRLSLEKAISSFRLA